MKKLAEGTKVTIHSLENTAPGEYRAIICGLAFDDIIRIYIVKMVDVINIENEYTCVTIPGACLKEGWN